ncbi:transposase [Ornithinimicrobium cerasi]|uniref:transposase n=1 Tax=Ornithinimicrobium cerasi TaxID=2248773 RepID=UPI003CC81BBC
MLLTAGDNPERLRSGPSFAALCGTAPVPVSSGRTDRHRLSRGGGPGREQRAAPDREQPHVQRRPHPRLPRHPPGPELEQEGRLPLPQTRRRPRDLPGPRRPLRRPRLQRPTPRPARQEPHPGRRRHRPARLAHRHLPDRTRQTTRRPARPGLPRMAQRRLTPIGASLPRAASLPSLGVPRRTPLHGAGLTRADLAWRLPFSRPLQRRQTRSAARSAALVETVHAWDR